MFNFFKKKPAEVVQAQKPNRKEPHELGDIEKPAFTFPDFIQPEASPSVTSDNGFIGLQRSPKDTFGWGVDSAQLGFFASGSMFIGYQACAMIATNWLVDKACNMPARDAIRNGYLINCGDDKVSEQLRKSDKRYNVLKNMRELI